MRIVCISSKDSLYDVINELKEKLEKEIANTDVELHYVQRHLDIPANVLQVKEADLIFVFVGYEELDLEVKTTMERLVDVDMKTDIRIVKAFEEVGVTEDDEERKVKEKELADKWVAEITSLLFHPERLKPGAENTNQ